MLACVHAHSALYVAAGSAARRSFAPPAPHRDKRCYTQAEAYSAKPNV